MNDMSMFSPEALAASGFFTDPYPLYAALRGAGPVVPVGPGRWAIGGHAAASAALRDRRFGVKRHDEALLRARESSPFLQLEGAMMLHTDPPDHTRLRALISRSFTPQLVAALEPGIQRLVEELLAQALAAGEVDLIADFAYPLPVLVIAEILGVPAVERGLLRGWSRQLTDAVQHTRLQAHGQAVDAAALARADAVATELGDYLWSRIEARRRDPGDDLLSALIAAEATGDRLSRQELISTCALLLLAGHETTMNLIGNGMLALLRNPGQRAAMTDPGLWAGAVEELLRFDSPVQLTVRDLLEPLELAGASLARGDEALILLGAANRDPARYERPDELDLRRSGVQPISFGAGIHYCIGAPLARLEGRLALGALCTRVEVALTGDPEGRDLAWNPNPSLRGLAAMPVRVTRR